MPPRSRTAACDVAEGRTRLRTAQAYLNVAASVLDERDRDEYLNVAAGLAVLGGIAASDAICCIRLGCRHRGVTIIVALLTCSELPHRMAVSWQKLC